jgi:hypothetical protein
MRESVRRPELGAKMIHNPFSTRTTVSVLTGAVLFGWCGVALAHRLELSLGEQVNLVGFVIGLLLLVSASRDSLAERVAKLESQLRGGTAA